LRHAFGPLAAAFIAAVSTANPAQAASEPIWYADASHSYRFTVPDGCGVRKSPHGNPYILCSDSVAAVTQVQGSAKISDVAAVMTSVTNGWKGMKIVSSAKSGTLGGESSIRNRVQGTEPDGTRADALFLAATHKGSWYVFVFVAPSKSFDSDSSRYFDPMQQSFKFAEGPF
jgi:hypothetical protein